MQLLFILPILAAMTAFAMGQSGSGPTISLTYTAENMATYDNSMFTSTLEMVTEKRAFIEIMDEAAEMDSTFRYVTDTVNGEQYVVMINDVWENTEAHLSWILTKRYDVSEDCLITQGVSQFVPNHGEHVAFIYDTWDTVARLPLCS